MEYKLKEVGKIVTGKTPSTKQEEYFSKIPDKYIFLTPKDMTQESKYIRKTERYLTDEVTKKFSSVVLNEKSICVSCIGSDMGKVYLVDTKAITNQQINSITEIREVCNVEYLYYYLKEKKKYFREIAGGSTMPILNKTDFGEIVISLPLRIVQDKIVKILSQIDSKIELNNQINDNLYELSCSLFKQLYELSNNNEVNLGELVNFSQGKQVEIDKQTLFYENGKKRFLRIVDYTNSNEPERYVEDFGKKYYVKDDDIVMIRYGSQTCGNVVRGKSGIIANNMFKIVPFDDTYKNYIYYFLNSSEIQTYIKQAQNSSTMPSINFSLLKQLPIKKIEKDLLLRFNNIIEPLRKKFINNCNENKLLEQIRDTLLPKLMNGEIDLENIEI